MEMEIYNWKYIFDGNGFDIIPNEPFEKPQILYKLYALNEDSIDSLTNQYVYATHPSQLNDIFDCNEELLDFDDIEAIQISLNELFPKPELNRMIDENFNNLKTFVQRNFRELIYRKWGVFSMTSVLTN
jgi:hypothetical protein